MGLDSATATSVTETHNRPTSDSSGIEILSVSPNPSNPEVRILVRLSETARIEMGIYDLRGRLVNRIIREPVAFGQRQLIWDGRNSRGERVTSGVYFVRLSSGKCSVSQKVTIIR